MAMPYWMIDTARGTLLFALLYSIIGLPTALALLPRADWRNRPLVIACALVCGGMLLSAWMFALSTLDIPFGVDVIVAPLLIIALIAGAIAWRKRHAAFNMLPREPLTFMEKLVIALIVIAVIVRWIVAAYWTFTAYDALWVYGYQARVYALTGAIPDSIGYYPQFLQLQFAFAQLPSLGGINDHVARGLIPLIHIGTILAVCALGAALINRRTGVILAGIWTLYPHVGEWSRAGDLEIPLTFAFTLAALFFLRAWTQTRKRDHHAALAGVFLGLGMWIKPTMGAFILGVVVLVIVDMVRVRFDLRAWLPRLRVAMITGIVCVPLGAVWYARNLLLGHNAIDFPPAYWQTLAERDGVQLGWLLAIMAVVTLTLWKRVNTRHMLIAWALILAGVLPTILPYWLPALAEWGIARQRMSVIEFALFGAGLVPLIVSVGWAARGVTAERIAWGLLLGAPYFAVWFWLYSYHYRLSFAVVPLLILPIAALIARSKITRRALVAVVVIALALPGVLAAVYDPFAGWDYLWSDAYSDDDARYRSGNAALMTVVDGLRVWQAENRDQPLIVAAPRVDRLPFFFPLEQIRTREVPTRLSEIEDVAYFVYGAPETIGAYQTIPITQNQVIGALGRQDVTRRAWGMDDGIFRYDVYEFNFAKRWTRPEPNGPETRDVVFGGFARYLGYDIGGLDFWQGRRVIGHLYWEAIAPADDDFSIFVHLRDEADRLIAAWDNPVARTPDGSYYSTLVWEVGEFISDQRVYQLPPDVDELGTGYRLIIGFYNPTTNQRLPLVIDGVHAGDELMIENRIELVTPPVN